MAVETIGRGPQARNGEVRSSLGTTAARNLATTTKTSPQMQGITNRWVQRILPWVEVKGGTYRVNRRVSYAVGDGRVAMMQAADRVTIVPGDLAEFPALRDYDDADVLTTLARRFIQREIEPNTVVIRAGTAIDSVFVIAHGRLARSAENQYGEHRMLGVLADGEYFGAPALTDPRATWDVTITAETACTLLVLDRADFAELVAQSGSLRDHLREFMAIDEKAVISYLVSTYFSAAVLVPDAIGMLENVEIGR